MYSTLTNIGCTETALPEIDDEEFKRTAVLTLISGEKLNALRAWWYFDEIAETWKTDPSEILMLLACIKGEMEADLLEERYQGSMQGSHKDVFKKVVMASIRETPEGVVLVSPFVDNEDNQEVVKRLQEIRDHNLKMLSRDIFYGNDEPDEGRWR